MRLVDADELLSIVRSMTVVDKSVMHRILIQMPTVDAVPVRRGKWIRIPQEEMFCCDQCGRRGLSFEEVDVYGYTHDPFCADCGARMDGDHHEG